MMSIKTVDKMSKLSYKQRLFCQEYLLTLNASEAARKAGYSVKTAKSQGNRLLTNEDIKAEIAKNQLFLAQKKSLSQEWFLDTLQTILYKCLNAEVDPEIDSLKTAKNSLKSKGQKFDSAGANKAIELIGKHLGYFERDNSQLKGVTAIKVDIVLPDKQE